MSEEKLRGFTDPPKIILPDFNDVRIRNAIIKLIPDDQIVFISTAKLHKSSFYGKSIKVNKKE